VRRSGERKLQIVITLTYDEIRDFIRIRCVLDSIAGMKADINSNQIAEGRCTQAISSSHDIACEIPLITEASLSSQQVMLPVSGAKG
jgi:hypothetical protein